MLLSYFVLATSVSIDSLGIGITYGLRNTKISRIAKIILFIISVLITTLSLTIGDVLNTLFPSYITTWISSIFLILMGLWIIYQSLYRNKEVEKKPISINETEIYQIFIRFLGITIQIIRDPISSDFDHSKRIDWKEAIYLGFALSLDSLCVGICSSILGFSSILFPLLVATFQLFFLSGGQLLGEKIASISHIPENIWSVLSGVLLICIAISRFFIA